MTQAKDVLTLAKSNGAVIATAESCTGGLVGAAITDLAGSSAIFDRGFITYSNAAKIDLLKVAPASLDTHGAVSEQVAREMAVGALTNSAATIAVSITGIAGPGGSDHKPEGRVCFGIATLNLSHAETIEFGALGRENVRHAAVRHALSLLHTFIAQSG